MVMSHRDNFYYDCDTRIRGRNSSRGHVSRNQIMKPWTKGLKQGRSLLQANTDSLLREGTWIASWLSVLPLISAEGLFFVYRVPLSGWLLDFLQHFILHFQKEKNPYFKTPCFFLLPILFSEKHFVISDSFMIPAFSRLILTT